MPPTPVPDKTVCDPNAALSFTYDERDATEIEGSLVTIAHASGDRTELGCATLTDMWQWLQTGPDGVPTVREGGRGGREGGERLGVDVGQGGVPLVAKSAGWGVLES